ncbi:MAG: hypothetical protein RMY29_011105 [Nostoc sp. CreGUA01]|nr:hypothetical protein [Nostoc sp. CreGUA01]
MQHSFVVLSLNSRYVISCSGEDLSLGLTRGRSDAGTRRNFNNK